MNINDSKLLGEGAYGCVYYPPLKCEGENKRRKGVGKVFFDEKNADVEDAIFNKINKLISLDKYAVRKTHRCKVSKIPKNCTRNNQNSQNQIILEPVGIDLMKYCNNNTYKFTDLLDGFVNIIDGLIALNNIKYCHHDIKPTNIIVTGNKSKNMLLIDFGSLIKYDQLYDWKLRENFLTSAFVRDYPYYPPELYLFITTIHGGIINNKRKFINKSISNIINIYIKQLKTDFEYIDFDVNTMTTQLEIFEALFINIFKTINTNKSILLPNNNNKNKLSNKFKDINNKLDVFSLGITMLQVFSHQNCDNNNLHVSQISHILSAIKQAIHFNPTQRTTLNDLKTQLKYIKTMSPKNRKKILI